MRNCYDCEFMKGVHKIRKSRKGLIDYKEVKFLCVKGHIKHQKSGADRTFKFHVGNDVGTNYKYVQWLSAETRLDFSFNGDVIGLEQIFPPTAKVQRQVEIAKKRMKENGQIPAYT